MKKTFAIIGLIIFLTISVFASCQGLQQNNQTADETPDPSEQIFENAVAQVESVQVAILESFPVQVQAIAKGYLPDSCTEIDKITKELNENTFNISITTKTPFDTLCTQVIKPFEENISLDVEGLNAGKYIVEINGKNSEFTLETDNVSPQT